MYIHLFALLLILQRQSNNVKVTACIQFTATKVHISTFSRNDINKGHMIKSRPLKSEVWVHLEDRLQSNLCTWWLDSRTTLLKLSWQRHTAVMVCTVRPFTGWRLHITVSQSVSY